MTARNYFNHAGCSIITERTKRAVVAQLELEAQLGSFIADQAAVTERQTLLELAAKAVGASASDMTLTDSHTTGWAKALQVLNIKSGNVLLATRSEWGGNLRPCSTWLKWCCEPEELSHVFHGENNALSLGPETAFVA